MAMVFGQVIFDVWQGLENILPRQWLDALHKTNYRCLCELRIRVGQPLSAKFYDGQHFINRDGCTSDGLSAFIPSKEDVQSIVFLACNKSIYAYTEQLLNGYVVLKNGARMGVCGTVVCEKGVAIGIKDFFSLCIRVPHAIYDCSKKICNLFLSPLKSVLVASKPSAGKTTLLRDMVYQTKGKKINTLVVDERREICGISDIKSPYKLNDTCDVMCDGNKNFAMQWGIRAMAPDLIVCDELFIGDMECVQAVAHSGIKLFASVHANSLESAETKLNLKKYRDVFEIFVLLSDRNGAGTIESVVSLCDGQRLL